ncbi:MAG: purine-nucleoside phosphorylase [Bacteroidetes bacterium]|nr:MAG: purine-nucleoside phosphorylase [Bacteroidota bacterium]
MSLLQHLQHTVSIIRQFTPTVPQVGIVLGSGLGNFKAELEIECEIPYGDIPHFPVSTVEGHGGSLIFGKVAGKQVVCMAGRFHYYEGYTPQDVAYPIRVMKMLGIELLLLSNAAGGMNHAFHVGDLMIIKDHISLFAVNPLLGPNEPQLGPRFPDMSEPYSHALIEQAKVIAERAGLQVYLGVYCGVTGPTFETRAEYNMLHILGADAVGMSTVQEVIVARHMDLPVFAISVITDLGIREDHNTITHAEVLEAAAAAEPKMAAIFKGLVAAL